MGQFVVPGEQVSNVCNASGQCWTSKETRVLSRLNPQGQKHELMDGMVFAHLRVKALPQ